jgi:hypothetical protein
MALRCATCRFGRTYPAPLLALSLGAVTCRRRPLKAWLEWNRAASHRITEIEGVGAVENRVDVTDVSGP